MTKVTIWTLPLNPPNYAPFYLQKIVSRDTNSIVYYKYIIDRVGILDINNNKVCEWQIPHLLFSSYFNYGMISSICIGPYHTVWGTLQDAHQIFRLQPENNMVECYGTIFGKPTSNSFSAAPFPHPRKIYFDNSGKLWYSGDAFKGKYALGPLIGCFNELNKIAQYWQIPGLPLVSISDLIVDTTTNLVWCSLYHTQSNIFLSNPFLGCLNLNNNLFRYWYYKLRPPLYPGYTGSRSITFDDEDQPKQIWLTNEADAVPYHQIIQFDLSSQKFFKYQIPSTHANPITIKAKIKFNGGHPWFSTDSGILTMIENFNCGTLTIPIISKVNLTPQEHSAESIKQTAQPFNSKVPFDTSNVLLTNDKCFCDVINNLPAGWCDLSLNDNGALYFSEMSGISIGSLEL